VWKFKYKWMTLPLPNDFGRCSLYACISLLGLLLGFAVSLGLVSGLRLDIGYCTSIFMAFGRYVFGTLGNEDNIGLALFRPLSPFQWPQNTSRWMTICIKLSQLRTAFWVIIFAYLPLNCLYHVAETSDVRKRTVIRRISEIRVRTTDLS